jgi:VWFA-related protein
MSVKFLAALCLVLMALSSSLLDGAQGRPVDEAQGKPFDQAQGKPRYAERVDVERVLVDVRVVDSFGQPVLGLTTDDFRVKIGGKPVAVQSITWVGGAKSSETAVPVQAEQARASNEANPLGRLIVFLFQKDLEPSRIMGFMRMLIEAQNILDDLTPNDRVAILSFDYHLKVWIDFTNDRERLLQVLNRGILFEDPRPVETASEVSLFSRLSAANARRTYTIERALHLIADALHDLPGSKSLVLVGHGFGRFSWTGVMMEHGYSEARRALVAARTSVFSMDVTNADYHSLEAGLQLVSKQTGGFFARTHLFTGQAMKRLAGALAGYYVLFVDRPDVGRGVHRIEVEMSSNRTASVLARDTFAQE